MSDRQKFLEPLHHRLFCWLEREPERRSGWQQIEGCRVSVATDIGHERTENQDRVVLLRSGLADGSEHLLIVVCDGMGGMQDGRVCASVAASGIVVAFLRLSTLPIQARLQQAARLANESVFLAYRGRGGATLSAVCGSSSGEVVGLNVGDSRIYGFAAGRITPLSVDDTIAGQIDGGRSDPEAHSLLQFIGVGPDLEPHVIAVPLETERVVITTDGTHFMPQEAMNPLVAHAGTATEVSRRLVRSAQWMGSRDNATAACLDLPLQVRAPGIERSIRVWDPWGELHLLAPPDHRPALVRHDVPVPIANEPQSSELRQPPPAGKQARHGRSSSRKAPREKGKSSARLALPPADERPEVEIIDISEDPA